MIWQREVKFFSREATHVITTRPIPAETDPASTAAVKGTVNPAHLETKKSVFDVALQKSNNGDILQKAREMGMKIWSAEKLQRMLDTMFNTNTGEQPPLTQTRHRPTLTETRAGRDLGKLLQNERINGAVDRDYSVGTQDVIQLRGYYIYIHDMDELTRPVMIREYPKVAKKEDGKWPQFRVSGEGKCPFVLDPRHTQRLQEKEREDQRARAAKAMAPRTRAAAALEEKRALGDNINLARRPSATEQSIRQNESKPLDPPKMIPVKKGSNDSMPPMFGSAQANVRAVPRFAGGEPVASGIQPSNVTSAIRSQMISSTAAAPGARAGNTKEVNQLKRKVLEKTNGGTGHSVMEDMRAALNQEYAQPARAAKRKAQDALGYIKEEGAQDEAQRNARKIAALRRRKTVEKELKPGYCENCREKFNDFDEVGTRYRSICREIANIFDSILCRVSIASLQQHQITG
jgi:regulatory subunit for Cdc7p protein kinase